MREPWGRNGVSIQNRFIAAVAALGFASQASAFDVTIQTDATGDLRARIEASSSVLDAYETGVTDASEIIAAAQTDYRSILGALYREGYYAPIIRIKIDGREGADLPLISLPKTVSKVAIIVDPGPRFTFGKTAIAPLAPNTVLPEGFATGQVARSDQVGAAKDAAIEAWRHASHAKADLGAQSIVADHRTQKLDVDMKMAPGPSVTFGRLRFSGNSKVSPERLAEIAGPIQGATFDPDTLETISKRLRRTGTFKSVSIKEAETLNADNSLDITATVADEKPRRFGFGAELSSLDGGTVSGYWMHRNISANADRLRFDAEVSGFGSNTGTDYSVSATYRRPATTRPQLTLKLSAKFEHLDEEDFLSDTASFAVGAEVDINDVTKFSYGIGYRYSDVTDDFGERTFSHVVFPLEASRDARDNLLNPTKGSYIAVEALPYLGLNGSANGARLYADARAYKAFGNNERFVVAGRVLAGSILGSPLAETPPDLLFFSGGSGTVRGQPYKSLDIDLGGGLSAGGTSFLGLSGELRTGITQRISVVGFVDAGAVGETSIPAQDAEWHAGAGLGLRYNTGFGPIRLDVAAPISGDTGNGVQLYVGIGQAF